MRLRGATALLAALALTVVAPTATRAAEEVKIDGLAGTLTTAQTPKAAALIIAGSGPTDRNGNSHLGLKTDAYKLLAEALADHGIVTLRYDKRGIGASAKSARPEAEVIIQHFVDDAVLAARWLQARVNSAAIFMIGHSEGGVMGLLAAEKVVPSGIVLLAAPGRTLGTILREQFSRPGTPRDITVDALHIIGALERNEDIADVEPRLAAAFRPSVQPYLRSAMAIDPAALARGLNVPLLIVGGGRDFQVGKSDFDALSAARPDADAYWDPDMAHTLKPSRADPRSVQQAYTDPNVPLAVGLATRIADFILERAR